ncbi:FHA domain-containing protein [bacterium]|nr:FHA domain-containing protein [bacterium]
MGFQLRIVQGENQGQVLPLTEKSILMGRATTMGEAAAGFLFFYEATVSRQHAELRWDEKKRGYLLHQRSQTNKTLVDNQPVDPKAPKLLTVGCKIQMGLLILSMESD